MPKYAQYPGPVVPQSGDLALLSRSPHIPGDTKTYDPSTSFTALAAQVNLSANQTWVGQIAASTFWPVWNNTTYNGSPTPGFDPDGMFNAAIDFPGGASPPGPPWPGFVVPVNGVYKVWFCCNLEALSTLTPATPAVFNAFIEQVPILFPTGAGTLFSDASFNPFQFTSELAFANANVEGAFNCLAGDAIFCGIDDANDFGANNNVRITTGSYFGIQRIR